jgi:hypothetical protein
MPKPYLALEPADGYPGGADIFYECMKCEAVIPPIAHAGISWSTPTMAGFRSATMRMSELFVASSVANG